MKNFFPSRCDIFVYLSVLDHFWPVWTLSRRHKKQDQFSDISLNEGVNGVNGLATKGEKYY